MLVQIIKDTEVNLANQVENVRLAAEAPDNDALTESTPETFGNEIDDVSAAAQKAA